MPIPGPGSTLHIKTFVGNITYGNTINNIGTQGTLSVTTPEVEITAGSTLIYNQIYLTVGNVAFTFTQDSSIFNFTHGSTKMIQPNSGFY